MTATPVEDPTLGNNTSAFRIRASKKRARWFKLYLVLAVDPCAPSGIRPIQANFYPLGRGVPSYVVRKAHPTYMTIMTSTKKCP